MFEIETLDYSDVAKTIDHSLLRPELDLETVREGVELALRYDVASATVRPADVVLAAERVAGSDVMISTVVGFPHGGHPTATKALETEELDRRRRGRDRHGAEHRPADLRRGRLRRARHPRGRRSRAGPDA